MFQSLSGFQVRCNLPPEPDPNWPLSGFNPYRVFKFAATQQQAKPSGSESEVSIPIGFSSSLQLQTRKARCSFHRTVSIPIGFSSSLQLNDFTISDLMMNWFQSLSGFQVRCNTDRPHLSPTSSVVFQSLSGFQVRCNGGGSGGFPDRVAGVSIPIGFSSSLQHAVLPAGCFSDGRFQSLSGFQVRCNGPPHSKLVTSGYKFQSLSGFQVRCNGSAMSHSPRSSVCFNPYRVFKFAATCGQRREGYRCSHVSIPIGFSSSLQQKAELGRSQLETGFNPYRVFKFAATTYDYGRGSGYRDVSIPIGFSSSLQRDVVRRMFPDDGVSIPIGFSSSLQRPELRDCGFQ